MTASSQYYRYNSIRIFYKDIFRLPSFNDLYYGETGNNKLKPENARQYNIGLTYSKDVCPFLPYLSATVDAYYNKITDKIIAYPTKNLAVWSMRNLGSVEIKGIDVTFYYFNTKKRSKKFLDL